MAYNHFVPRRLLKGFANDSEHFFAYDCEGVMPTMAVPIDRAGGKQGAYPDSLEVALNRRIEDPFNVQVLAKLERGNQLLREDLAALVEYVLTMYRRVPAGRDRVAQHIGPAAQDLAREFEDGLNMLAAADPSQIEKIEEFRRRAAAVIEHALAKPEGIWHDTVLRDDVMSEAANISLQMSWDCLAVPAGKQLLIGDNPVLRSPDGLKSATGWVLMPISSTHALRATWRPGPGFAYGRLSTRQVRTINHMIAAQATRFVYFRRNEPWVVPLIERARGPTVTTGDKGLAGAGLGTNYVESRPVTASRTSRSRRSRKYQR